MASLKTGAGHYKYSTISKLMKTYLLLPNSNADSKRVFSMVNKICTEHRADLAQDTVAGVLSVKVNSRVDPQRFEPSRIELGKAKSATMEYSRTPLIRPPSESHWCGRIRGMVAREGFVYTQKPLSVTRNVVV